MCNTDTRITDPKKRKAARNAVKDMSVRIGQQETARRLKVNPGIVSWLIKETDPVIAPQEIERLRWTHVTLDELLMLRIETAHAFMVYGASISDEAKQHADRAFELLVEATRELRALNKELKKL